MKISFGKLSLSRLVIFIILIAMYSIGTITAFFSTWIITLLLLLLSFAMIFLKHWLVGKWTMSNIVVSWMILSVLCLIGAIRGSALTDISFYFICLSLLLMGGELSFDAMFHSLRWVKFFGLFFAFGCYWQYLFPDRYYAILYPLFDEKYQDSIRRQFTNHKMCPGFTFQTAVTAQFIILGIMVVLYLYYQNITKKEKTCSIFELAFLFGGLLLTGKRSPIVVLPVVIIFVDMLTTKRSKKVKRLLTISIFIIVIFVLLYFLSPLLSESRNSISRLLEYSFDSVEDLETASNGRFNLASHAISEFLKHPLFGIGWGNYAKLYNPAGAHNIYLQLLCECGMIGFLLAVSAMYYAFSCSIGILKQLDKSDRTLITLMKCSVFIQMYTFVYGLFGNPIYDQSYLLMYFWGLLIAIVCDYYQRSQARKKY